MKKYGYYLGTGSLACQLGLPDDSTCISGLLQCENEDNFELTLKLKGITEKQLKAVMLIVNSVDALDSLI